MKRPKFEHIGNALLLDGIYLEDEDIIYLARGLTPWEREITYFHERQHQKCLKEKCTCWTRKTNYLAECHAMQAECRDVLKSGSKKMAFVYLDAVDRAMKRYKVQPLFKDHQRAMERVMKSDIFKLVQKLAKGKPLYTKVRNST